MKPVFFIGSVPIPAYHTIITLGIFIGIFVYLHFCKKFKLNDLLAIDSAIIVIISGFIGARAFHVIFEMPDYYLRYPTKIFAIWEGGFVFYGAVIFGLLGLLIYLKLKHNLDKFFVLTDAFVIALSIGSFIGRWGCFFQGCCYGKPSKLPWAVSFHDHMSSAPLGVPLHPTQIYMSSYNLIIFLILLFIYKRYYKAYILFSNSSKAYYGVLSFSYLILYSISRFIVEYFRADFRGDFFAPYLSTSQFIGLCIFVLSLPSVYFIMKKNRKL